MTCSLCCTHASKPARVCPVRGRPWRQALQPHPCPVNRLTRPTSHPKTMVPACVLSCVGAVGRRPPGSALLVNASWNMMLVLEMAKLNCSPELIYFNVDDQNMALMTWWHCCSLCIGVNEIEDAKQWQNKPKWQNTKFVKAFESTRMQRRTKRTLHIKAGHKFLVVSQTNSHQSVPVKLSCVLRQHIWHKPPKPLVPAIIALKSLRKPRGESVQKSCQSLKSKT